MKVSRIVAQALPVLLIALGGELLAGTIFGRMHDLLAATPGLLVLVPALLALRGNINAAIGSRLASAVHLGLVPPHVPFDENVRTNLVSSVVLGAVMGAFAGALAHGTSLLFADDSAGILVLPAIGFSVGLLSGLAMAPVTTRAVRVAFRRGLDPDNVVAPILLMLGDIITITLLFAVAALLGGARP